MSQQKPQNLPPSLLKNALNKEVQVSIKIQNLLLKGVLKQFDSYSNIILTDVTEMEKSAETFKEIRKIDGQVFVKGDSIVHIVF
jgi:small nuclear ribonucleoprotein (snRNP)-like protein